MTGVGLNAQLGLNAPSVVLIAIWCGVGADAVRPSGGNYAWKSAATYKSATTIVGAPARSLGVGGLATPLAMHCYTQVPQLQFKEPRGRRLLE